jgi:NADPH-dependent 2,4-dienoyl-CoA reductase/sulfur reductase-like enzyme
MADARTIAVIGAGPVGLAAAAHALERGLKPLVIEAGPEVGHTVRQWGHVRMFSSWEHNIDQTSGRLLDQAGWNRPDPAAYPTGAELIERYLDPLATRTALEEHIHTGSRVTAISRVGFDKVKTAGRERARFELHIANGRDLTLTADAVIDASGTWGSPNPAGASGLPAVGETENGSRIAYGMPDVLGHERARYSGRTVAVVGAGHSAIGTLIDLARLADAVPGTRPIWLLRGDKPEKAFGGGAGDQLVERGALGALFAGLVRSGKIEVHGGFRVTQIAPSDAGLSIISRSGCGRRAVAAEELIVATGFRPDLSFLRELRVVLDPSLECPPALAPLIDPNLHSCGTVRPHGARELAQPEPGFYVAGMKSYGRAPTFLMMTGYEQVRSIVAEIAGDREAAGRVELVLPETGVCGGSGLAEAQAGCCGGPPVADTSACCQADELAKAEGNAGCGCGSTAARAAAAIS